MCELFALKAIERYIRFRIQIIITKFEMPQTKNEFIQTVHVHVHSTVIGIHNLCFAFNGSELFECEMLFVITALRGRVREWLWRHRIARNIGSNDYFISRWNSMNIIMSFTASTSLLPIQPNNLQNFNGNALKCELLTWLACFNWNLIYTKLIHFEHKSSSFTTLCV